MLGIATTPLDISDEINFVARMMPRDEEVEAPARCLRDLGRAVNTFALVADIENDELFCEIPYSGGPFALPKGREWSSSIVLRPAKDVDEDQLYSHLRAGVRAATALLRSAGYRVSLQLVSAQQLVLPDSGAPSSEPEPDPTALAGVEPPEADAPAEEAGKEEAPTEPETPAEPAGAPEAQGEAKPATTTVSGPRVRKKKAS
jgi:hypothetical protein